MGKRWIFSAALALASVPGAAFAQDGAKLDCISATAGSDLKSGLGAAMSRGEDAGIHDALFEQLAAIAKGCASKHGVGDPLQEAYFNYGLARIARDWLTGEIAKASLSTGPVDKALDFGINGANPDLTNDMGDDAIMAIITAYQDAGVDVDAIDQSVWEKVGAYAAATSIYWANRKKLAP